MANNKKHILFIGIFLCVLLAPTLVQVTGLEDNIIDNENRTKSDFPKINKKKPFLFVRKFKSYYKDNFGLRNTFSNNYLRFKNDVLNENSLPNKAIKGSNDFLFLGNSFSNVINESLGFTLFTKQELNQIKTTVLERQEWLSKQNIKFYIAVAPNKHVVYKENLPFRFPNLPTRKEQLLDYLKSTINFEIIDLGEQFIQQKKKNRLYRKYDSHWNDLGAFYATQTLLNSIKKDFDINNINIFSYKIDSLKSSGGISKMLNFSRNETKIILTPKFKNNVIDLDIPKYYSNQLIYESRHKNPSKKYKVLLFRDSFSGTLKPFINHTFRETTFIWSHKFDKDLVLKEKPDLVIMEYIERYLERLQE